MIKTTPADKAFSLCVRTRVDFTCERCGTYAPPELSKRLDCAHFHGRGKWAVRHDPDNAFALCMGCHLHLTAHPLEHIRFAEEKLGNYRCDALWERARDTARARRAKREAKEMAAHYRAELKRMQEERAKGVTGRIEFAGYL